ncbi:sensor histidine kinase [Pelomonas sp. Root1444]|uniref:sensor histidine kinase n=1 Tax=Pelomonas sp. Root1444 TaxID=1736464 RepID=UPI00138F987C|nr:sensor histidine kinase [Pelomonas sp. Root1444]
MSTGEKGRKPSVKRAKASFEIDASLFEELGERLVSKPEVALAELIKNSYDADGTTCTLTLGEDSIIVADDGHGMTEQQFLGNWMVVSSQKKGDQRFSRAYRRSMAGSKGVGRFSARFLGHQVELRSVAFDEDAGSRTLLVAVFDWQAISRSVRITKVVVPYTVERVGDSVALGTTLTITKLRSEADRISIAKVKTDILRLTDPITGLERPPFVTRRPAGTKKQHDPGFSVVFSGEKEEGAGDFTEDLQTQILDAFVGRVRLEVTETGLVTYEVFWRGKDDPIKSGDFKLKELSSPFTLTKTRAKKGEEQDVRGLKTDLEKVQQLPLATALNTPVFIDLRFFPKRAGTFKELGLNGTKAQKWIREHASIAVVDNTFAMSAYAGSSDWLGIDASKATNERNWQSVFTPVFFPMSPEQKKDTQLNPMLALPRGPQLIGRIHIATRKLSASTVDESDDWLQANMDRESLRDNGAFRLLWHLSRFCAETIAHFDREHRLAEERQKKATERKEAKSALAHAIAEIRSSSQIEPDHRNRIVGQLELAQDRIEATEQYDREARASLELMSMMGVMAGFLTHEFEKAVGSLTNAADIVRKLAKLDPGLAGSAERLTEIERNLAHYMDYMRMFVDKARDPVPQDFKAAAQIRRVVQTLQPVAEAHGVDITVDVDRALKAPSMPIAAYHGIVANLLSNALKALVPKRSSEQRHVRIYATNDQNRHVLVCLDNGIGIPDYLRDRIWDPLYTTTANGDEQNPLGSGLGLGLNVVHNVVRKLHGTIKLMDPTPPGFSTGFRVTLPLDATAK